MFTQNTSLGDKFFAESIEASKRGRAVSLRDMYGPRQARTLIGDARFMTPTLHSCLRLLQSCIRSCMSRFTS